MAVQLVNQWNPLNLGSTLQAWYTTGYNATFGTWPTQVGTNTIIDVTTGTGATKPTAGTINGHSCPSFNGTSDILIQSETPSATTGRTVWGVIKHTTLQNPGIIMSGSAGTDVNIQTMAHPADGVPIIHARHPTGRSGKVYSLGRVTLTRAHTFIITRTNLGKSDVYVDGHFIARINDDGASVTTSPYYIGAVMSGSPLLPFNGIIGNLGITNAQLTSTELNGLRWYLNDWAGVSWENGISGPSIY